MTKEKHSTMTITEAREAILDAMIETAGRDGWTQRAFDDARRDAGVAGALARLAFPGGPSDVLREFCAAGDRAMSAALEGGAFNNMKTGARIAAAVRARLEADADHKDAVRMAIAALATPLNAPLALQALYATVDGIWRAVEDGGRDFSFYTKRASLAGVYSATVLYWLGDTSPGHEKTWRFLDDRLKDVVKIGQARSAAQKLVSSAPSPRDILAGLRDGVRRRGAGRGR